MGLTVTHVMQLTVYLAMKALVFVTATEWHKNGELIRL